MRIEAVLGHDRGDVGVVVLHRHDHRGVEPVACPSSGAVARMEIDGHDVGVDRIQRAELLDRRLEGIEGGEVLHVAQMLADPRMVARREAERVLQLATDREHRTVGAGPGDGDRGEPASPSHREQHLADQANDRVVTRHVDGAVVGEHRVAEAGEARRGVIVAVGNGLTADVAARHHQRRRAVRHEQVLDRRVRQHHSDERVGRSDER
ncbi:MAG: hypothetical protein R2715_00240 [Ilumatobacteraceae bacterium]